VKELEKLEKKKKERIDTQVFYKSWMEHTNILFGLGFYLTSKEYEELKSIIAELYRLVDKATEEYKRLG